MTDKELISSIRALESRKNKEVEALEERFRNERKALIQSWADEKARFKVGDVIRTRHPHDNGYGYIRIESIEGHVADSVSPYPEIWYIGRNLFPDLVPANGKGIISDDGSRDIEKVTEPPYTGFSVTSESGELMASSYKEALSVAQKNTTIEKSSIIYGILPSGNREEILKVQLFKGLKSPIRIRR